MPLVPPDTRLTGRWSRTLLVRPDGRTDTTTEVTWLQAHELYVDLRVPGPDRPAGVLEGFAGRLRGDRPWTCWDRLVDLRPSAAPDEGRLDPVAEAGDGATGDVTAVVETGRHESYQEHWSRTTPADVAVAAAELREESTGAVAVLVRVGEDVGWASGPAAGRPPAVALGVVGPDGDVRLTSGVADPVGRGLDLTVPGTWRVVATEGDPALLPLALRATALAGGGTSA